MSIQLIQNKLDSYNCRTELEEQQAIREIIQEVVLAAMGRGDFFRRAVFQGGTCLRIFHGLNRFSEDLDFILKKPDTAFDFKNHLDHLKDELSAYGLNVEITDRKQMRGAVKTVFLKDDSIGKVIHFEYSGKTGPFGKIRIKMEIDTNPPVQSGSELKYLDFPFASSVQVQDLPSLFAGKMHALLCREYIKGRDWYDFIWYTANSVDINYHFLTAAMDQNGPWENQGIVIDKEWVVGEMKNKILSIDWEKAVSDVRHFIPEHEQQSLKVWSADFFMHQLDKWA